MITAGTFLFASLALLATDVLRYIRKVARPRLIRALAPFDPTLEELESLAAKDTVVAEVARRINLKRLHRDLRAEPVEFD